jgi:hypothetical protein
VDNQTKTIPKRGVKTEIRKLRQGSVPRVKTEFRPISEIYHPSSVPELPELEICTLYTYPSFEGIHIDMTPTKTQM